MPLRKPACAVEMANNITELRRRRDLESLRIFLKLEHCFQASVNADEAIITMEELKKLARAWKLHGIQRFVNITIA